MVFVDFLEKQKNLETLEGVENAVFTLGYSIKISLVNNVFSIDDAF